jgi:peptidoglycan/LPS O-acetylase OafA/YrhL
VCGYSVGVEEPGLPRIPELDGIRALAIVLVISVHVTGTLGIENFTQGQLGVDAFLLLSGFLLAYRHRDEQVRSFALRRLETIAPTYWVALAGLVVALRVSSLPLPTTGDLTTHLLFVHAVTDRYYGGLDRAWWYVSAIVLLYISYLLVRPLVARGRWAAVLLAGIALETAALILFADLQPTVGSGVFEEFLPRVLDFYIGAAFGTFIRAARDPRVGRETPGFMVASVLALLAGSFYAYHLGGGFAHTVALGMVVALAGLIVGAAAHDERCPRLLMLTIGWLSAVSYELYLLHNPLIGTFNARYFSNLAWPFSGERGHLAAGIALGLVISLILAEALRRIPWTRLLAGSEQRRWVKLAALCATAAFVSFVAGR